MRTAQPALLYLVPTTLGSVTLLALCRREFWLFFTGKARAGSRERRSRHIQTGSVSRDTDTEASEGEKETLIDQQ
jgi:hypothetical protein